MSPEVKTFYYILGKFVWACDHTQVTEWYPLAGHVRGYPLHLVFKQVILPNKSGLRKEDTASRW